jgi:hypothetical protein
MTERRELGVFADPDGLVTLLRARQVEIGLSNEGLERLCGFAAGQIDKYLGPSREKAPGAFVLATLMDALGVSGALYVDPTKVARLSKAWAREGRRSASSVRVETPRVSKRAVKRVMQHLGKKGMTSVATVATEAGRKGGKSRWANSTPEQRSQAAIYMNHVRWGRPKIPTEPEK